MLAVSDIFQCTKKSEVFIAFVVASLGEKGWWQLLSGLKGEGWLHRGTAAPLSALRNTFRFLGCDLQTKWTFQFSGVQWLSWGYPRQLAMDKRNYIHPMHKSGLSKHAICGPMMRNQGHWGVLVVLPFWLRLTCITLGFGMIGCSCSHWRISYLNPRLNIKVMG